MNVDTFFERFRLITRASNGISRLRELVLQLAVSGRLFVDPERQQTSGQELLESVGIVSAQPIDAPKLPNHWAWATLGSAAVAMNSGWSPACPPQPANEDQWGVLKTTAVQSMSYLEGENKVLPSTLSPRTEAEVQDGDILLTRAGPKNRVGIICVAKPTRKKLMISDKIIRIHLFEGMVPEFTAIALNSGYSSACIESMKTGMAASQMNISQQKLRTVPIPIPPTSEQQRIVAKVDELMRLCDRLESQLAKRAKLLPLLSRANHDRFVQEPTEENLNAIFHEPGSLSVDDIRETIITMGVFGALTERSDGGLTSSALLDVLRDRQTAMQERVVGRSRQAISGLVSPVWSEMIPKSWELTHFDEVAVITSGVTKGRNLTGKRTITLPYLRVANVQRWHVLLDEVKEIEVLEEDLEKYRLLRGDVVMIEGGDWDKLGRAAIWNEEIKDCIHQNHIFRLRSPDQELLIPEWIVLFVNSRIGRAYFESCSKQTTNLASINMTQLRACPLPLPPSSEQEQIVARVRKLLELVDKLQDTKSKASRFAELFAQAAVSKLTGSTSSENEQVKPPKIEVVTSLRCAKNPPENAIAPLSELLAAEDLSAKVLWQRSGLEIDRFYAQLKTEIANGWIAKPEPATVTEVEAG